MKANCIKTHSIALIILKQEIPASKYTATISHYFVQKLNSFRGFSFKIVSRCTPNHTKFHNLKKSSRG